MNRVKLFLKKYWYWFLFVAVGIIGFAVLRTKPSLYKDLLNKYRDLIRRNQRESEAINDLRKKEQQDLEKNKRGYDSKIKDIELKSKFQKVQIEKDRERKIEELKKKTNGDPKKMSVEVSKFFGVPVATTQESDILE